MGRREDTWLKTELLGPPDCRCVTQKSSGESKLAPAQGHLTLLCFLLYGPGIMRGWVGSRIQHIPLTWPCLPAGSRTIRSKSSWAFPLMLPCKAHLLLSVTPGFPPELWLSRFLIPLNICVSAVFSLDVLCFIFWVNVTLLFFSWYVQTLSIPTGVCSSIVCES